METGDVDISFEKFRIPKQRKVVENSEVSGERHIVRQSRAGQWDVDIVHQVVVSVDHPIVQVRRSFAVIEEQHFVGAVIDFRVR